MIEWTICICWCNCFSKWWNWLHLHRANDKFYCWCAVAAAEIKWNFLCMNCNSIYSILLFHFLLSLAFFFCLWMWVEISLYIQNRIYCVHIYWNTFWTSIFVIFILISILFHCWEKKTGKTNLLQNYCIFFIFVHSFNGI